MLAHYRSVKVKRLFFSLADRHHRAWLKRLDKHAVEIRRQPHADRGRQARPIRSRCRGISMPLADIYRRQVALLSASCLSSRKEKSFALKGDIALRPRSRPPCCAAASTMWSFAASPRPWKTPLVLPRNEDRVETTRSLPWQRSEQARPRARQFGGLPSCCTAMH
jgi:hypothetical protein